MQRIFLSLLACYFLCTVSAQDLSSILEAHYEAAAQAKMQKIETMITTGISTIAMTSFESAYKIYQSRPDKLRVEGDFQGSKMVQTFNGDSAWKYAPTMGVPVPAQVSGEEKKNLLKQVQFENLLWNYKERGAEIEVVECGENEPFHLLFTNADKEVQHFFIDRESHLISSIKTTQKLSGSEAEIEVFMEEYIKVKGIPIAHRMITRMNGQVVSALDILKVEMNRRIASSLFEKPPTD
ncbi:MAG: hypothetical protein GY790_13685 [Bacteroidetes bacterium]|nr:hypothetical protein [Bacteroidota bacterium]